MEPARGLADFADSLGAEGLAARPRGRSESIAMLESVPRLSTLIFTCALAVPLAVAPSGSAEACGAMLFSNHDVRTGGMSGQELFMAIGPTTTTLVLSANFIGVDGDKAFLLPLMAAPNAVRDADDTLFVALETGTVPVVSIEQGGDAPASFGCAAPGDGSNLGRGGSGVEVLDRGQTETYDYVVVGGDSGMSLADWLNDAGFGVPSEYQAALDDYIDAGWVFLAARLGPTSEGRIAPLELELPTGGPATTIPFGIGSYSLAPDQELDITLYVAADGPVIPQNYAIDTIDSDALEAVDEDASNYGELFDARVEAEPTWVVEYSRDWDVSDLDWWVEGDWERGINVEAEVDPAWLTEFHERLELDGGRLTRFRTRLGAAELSDLQLDLGQLDNVDRDFYVTWDPDGDEPGCGVGPTPQRGLLWIGLAALGLVRVRRRRG